MPERSIVTVCINSRGVHWTPALMKFYVLQKCFDIMEIMYSFVAANRVRRYSIKTTLQHLYNMQ